MKKAFHFISFSSEENVMKSVSTLLKMVNIHLEPQNTACQILYKYTPVVQNWGIKWVVVWIWCQTIIKTLLHFEDSYIQGYTRKFSCYWRLSSNRRSLIGYMLVLCCEFWGFSSDYYTARERERETKIEHQFELVIHSQVVYGNVLIMTFMLRFFFYFSYPSSCFSRILFNIRLN